MSPAIAIGLLVGVFGIIMAGEPQMFGMKTAAAGLVVLAAGGFLCLFGMYGGTSETNHGGGGRRVRDNSI